MTTTGDRARTIAHDVSIQYPQYSNLPLYTIAKQAIRDEGSVTVARVVEILRESEEEYAVETEHDRR